MFVDPQIQRLHGQIRDWRRELHAHPELAFEETRTSAFVADRLRQLGVEVTTGLATTGLVGTLKSGSGSKSIALRADMDALPLTEDNQFEHRSVYPGKMHACGHDGHTAMLLGAAAYLAKTKDFDGSVHFIFQPAEEGRGGGRVMVEEGLFERFAADAVFAIHNWPGLEVGQFAIRTGPMMAAMETFEIEVVGRGCHAAMPHLGVDPIAIGAQLVSSLQTIVARTLDPLAAAVVSVTQFHAGEAMAIIPKRAVLKGTCRNFKPDVSRQIEANLRRLADHVCQANGAKATVKYERHYPPTVNSQAEAMLAAEVAKELVGAEHVRSDLDPSMGAEDFAFMLQQRPGAYIWLGNGSTAGGCLLHNPNYDFNDEVIPVGVAFWAKLVKRFLSS